MVKLRVRIHSHSLYTALQREKVMRKKSEWWALRGPGPGLRGRVCGEQTQRLQSSFYFCGLLCFSSMPFDLLAQAQLWVQAWKVLSGGSRTNLSSFGCHGYGAACHQPGWFALQTITGTRDSRTWCSGWRDSICRNFWQVQREQNIDIHTYSQTQKKGAKL